MYDWKLCTSSPPQNVIITFSTFRWAKKRPLHRSTTKVWQWGRTWRALTRTWRAPTQARPRPPLLCLCLLLLSSKRLLSVIYLMQEKYIHIHPGLCILENLIKELVGRSLVGLTSQKTNVLENIWGLPLQVWIWMALLVFQLIMPNIFLAGDTLFLFLSLSPTHP